jgi:hypothetical protein
MSSEIETTRSGDGKVSKKIKDPFSFMKLSGTIIYFKNKLSRLVDENMDN